MVRDGTVSGDMTGDRVYKDKMTVEGNFSRSPERYYLEWMGHKAGVNGDIDAVYTTEVARNVSTDFEILGDNGVSALSTYSATLAAMTMTTDTADNDQMILLPHLDSEYSQWTGVKWGTENQVIWEAAITTGSTVTSSLLWAGLKLTNTPTIATDDNQVFFRYSTDDSDAGWVVESSIAGTDTAKASGVTCAADTAYRFRIEIDSDRKAHCYINDELVEVTTALTDDIDLIPYIGLQNLSAAARAVNVHYEKISRVLFE